jgi:hypothetical protein
MSRMPGEAPEAQTSSGKGQEPNVVSVAIEAKANVLLIPSPKIYEAYQRHCFPHRQ